MNFTIEGDKEMTTYNQIIKTKDIVMCNVTNMQTYVVHS